MRVIHRFFLLGTLFFAPFVALASEKMVVTPAFQDLALEAGQSLTTKIEIQNQTGVDQEFSVRSVSFASLDLSGGVAFLGTEINNDELPSADFIVFENNSLNVPKGETKTFSLRIEDREELSPGGHYAAVIFQSLPVAGEDASQKIAVRQIFSSLIFLEKRGGEKKSLTLKALPEKRFLWLLPNANELFFVNTGNTHVVPRGTVEITDTFGHIKARAILNEVSAILLPGQERLFPVNLEYQPWLPGRYTLLVSYRHDGSENVVEMRDSFFLFPWRFVVLTGIATLFLLLLRKVYLGLPEKKVQSF